jgi:hypothetical protein
MSSNHVTKTVVKGNNRSAWKTLFSRARVWRSKVGDGAVGKLASLEGMLSDESLRTREAAPLLSAEVKMELL